MIPELVDGVLPEGMHDCTFAEVETAFGRFWRTDRRIQLTAALRQFVDEARKSGIVAAIVIDGSYVTAKAEPNDIDLIVAYRPDFDLSGELRPFEYNVLSRRAVRTKYRFDAFAVPDGSTGYVKLVEFFARVRMDDPDQSFPHERKGLLRVAL